MADEKGSHNAESTNGSVDTDETGSDETAVDRRNYLKLTAAGAAALGGFGLTSGPGAAAAAGGPPNPDNWQLSFEDTFDAGSLDTSKWEVGYGWGLTDRNSAGKISPDEVNVSNGQLHLSVTYDGDITTSGVNTKDLHSFGPGSYWEASIKLPGRTGILPAFWSKPNTEDWPPEIDFVELFQNDGGTEDTHRAEYHIHYSTSTVSNDGSTHDSLNVQYDSSNDLTEGFHVYGCQWLDDRVDFYFDDVHVGSITDSTAMEALRNGGPQYMMLTNMIDKIGTTDKSEHWTEEMVVDWVRVWETGSGGSTTTDGTDSTTDDSTSDSTSDTTDHYFWVRSGGSEPVTYAFETSGGNVRIDDGELHSGESDEWVSSDGYTAGGVEDNTGGDGFWFNGEITDLSYEGPIETYVDDQYVDPDSLVDSSKPGPEKPSDSTEQTTEDTTTEETTTESSSSFPNTISFDGNSGSTSYSVTVSDSIEAAHSVESDDSVSGSTANGTVGSGVDSFGFSGEISSLRVDGDADVLVNGTKVDLLTIGRSSDSSGSVKYIVETSGQVIKARTSAASINSFDKVSGSRAFGRVVGGNDAYWVIGGDVLDVSAFGGNVETDVNGTSVDFTG